MSARRAVFRSLIGAAVAPLIAMAAFMLLSRLPWAWYAIPGRSFDIPGAISLGLGVPFICGLPVRPRLRWTVLAFYLLVECQAVWVVGGLAYGWGHSIAPDPPWTTATTEAESKPLRALKAVADGAGQGRSANDAAFHLVRLLLPAAGAAAGFVPQVVPHPPRSADVGCSDVCDGVPRLRIGVDPRDLGDEGRMGKFDLSLLAPAAANAAIKKDFDDRLDEVFISALDETESTVGRLGSARIRVLRTSNRKVPGWHEAYVSYGGVIVDIMPFRNLGDDDERALFVWLRALAERLVAHYDDTFAPVIETLTR